MPSPSVAPIVAPSTTSTKRWEPPASIAVALPLPSRIYPSSLPDDQKLSTQDSTDLHIERDDVQWEDLHPVMGAALRSAGFEQVDASALDRLSRDFDAFFTTICAYSVLQARTRRVQIHDVASTFESLGDAFSMQALKDFAHGPTPLPNVDEMTRAADEQRGETTRHERNLQHFAASAAAREAEREQRAQQAGNTPAWAMLGSGFLGSSERRESELEVLHVSSSEDGASDEEANARSRSGKRRRFAHQVPARATCQRDKIVPTSADDNPEHVFGVPARLADDVQCEEIPAWLPAFPDGHTWKRTPVFPQSTSTSLRPLELVELKLEHSRLTQEALARLIRSTDAASSGSKLRARAVSKSRSDASSWAPYAKSMEVAPASPRKVEEHYGTRSRTRTNTQPAAQADSPLSSPPPSQLTSGDNALASSDAADVSTPNEPRKRAKLALRLRVGSNRSSNASEVFDGASFPTSHGSMGPPVSSSPAPVGAGSTIATDERYPNPPIPQSAMVPSSMLTPMFESVARARQRRSASVAFADPFGSAGLSPLVTRTGFTPATPRGSTSGPIFWSDSEQFQPRASSFNTEPQTPATGLLPSTPFVYPPTPADVYASHARGSHTLTSQNPRANGGTPDAVEEEDPLPQAVHYRSQKVTKTARK
ncbi:hypothetical protein IE81DRAFT_345987 [Ceraceosorus guamensis]|uniref:Transcription factor TFIID subunit 8 C-terminal domain-containing protein n=1 Tax=Ceraceosorus guamensis TaxID=1522189 RepID=A0A316W3F4_9BASI|nr:hypothetical protein IE81DRAFT_345987 [Ceraceosorus guamensis]PWN44044.1 hypothetical protein IE81DRAFT_345987 [Ceraceosorus guamensis]